MRMMRRRMVRRARRRRRRVIVGGMLLIGGTSKAIKMSQADAQKVQQETGMAPEEMEPEDLDATMKDLGIQSATGHGRRSAGARSRRSRHPGRRLI